MGKDWHTWFSDTIMYRGKEYYVKNHVREMVKTNGGYSAMVIGTQLYHVRLAVDNGKVIAASCDCPHALDGNRCKHQVAAILKYEEITADEKKQQKVNKIKKVSSADRLKWVGNNDSQEDYQFFDLDAIEKTLVKNDIQLKEALSLLEDGDVTFKEIRKGDTTYDGKQMLEVIGNAKDYSGDFARDVAVSFRMIDSSILTTYCGCRECNSRGYYWQNPRCEHVKALFFAAYKDIKNQHLIDSTDSRTLEFIQNFQNRHALSVVNETVGSFNKQISLKPRLVDDGEGLELSFKIGASRMYNVKDITQLNSDIKNNRSVKYGKNTVLPLAKENFDVPSLKYIDFIDEAVSSIGDGIQYIYGSKNPYLYSGDSFRHFITDSIPVTGKLLDAFYDAFNQSGVDFENYDGDKYVLKFKEKNPKLDITIAPYYESKNSRKKVFSGINVRIQFPEFFYGYNYAYYLDDDYLCRISDEVFEKMKPLLEEQTHDYMSLKVGRNYLSDFYHTILPELKTFAEVKEEKQNEIEKYLTSDVEFAFYLDAENGNVLCKTLAIYGENEYNITDCAELTSETASKLERERIFSKEYDVLQVMHKYMPYIDKGLNQFHCDKDEDLIYDFVTTGVEEIARLGEVQATDAFQHVNVFKKANLSVGVSLSSGMLDLEVSSDEISREELLEVLASYRAKKKYHRLRDNSYVNLNDEALATLDEMLETLQISEKDFLKDNMHIPVYRTLYLDKLLEENDGIYEDRDDRFKELVKGFKTVKDAEFKAPAELSKIMRNYQKTGFKWISTLDKYGFGGILCDDMGLGKTLQTISFLAKHYYDAPEDELPSLVVCPASLVYNWQEEFKKFAPDVKVCPITGSATEREEIINNVNQYQVLVTSYDLLKRDVASYDGKEFYYEIIDEAQYIKNHTTAAAKAVKVINSRRRLALTGTPIENRLSELWSIFDFLMPGFLYKYDRFRRQFETPIVKYEDKEASERLKKMVAPFLLRRLKENVLKELPEKLEKQQTVILAEGQRTLYDAQVTHLKQIIEQSQKENNFNENKMKILAEMTRLRQICCDPSLYLDNYKGESAKREACMDLVERAIEAGHRMLVFSQFTTMLDLLKKDLDKAGIGYFEITGSTKKEDRLELVNRFNEGENNVFLISLKAGGTGLNLVGADVVIHYDPWWNLAAQNQATDRAHRIGQKKTVTVYKLISKGTIEEKIVELQNSKSDLADEILSGETNVISKMTEADFIELLG